LSVVYGREINGEEVTFGLSGYTMKNVFVLYDRSSKSVWYPLTETHLHATSGSLRGATIEFLAKPAPMPLGEWRTLHPDTKVLLPR
jgi:hypothetical protein